MIMDRTEIVRYLELLRDGSVEEGAQLFARAVELRDRTIGDLVSVRGLIEVSNRCIKNCYYCGIRGGNQSVERYELTDKQVYEAAHAAWKAGYGSVVMQAGERTDQVYVQRIEKLVKGIKSLSYGDLGITLSLGEQSEETYRRWFEAGAHRYLLRIETTSSELYGRLHPADHLFEKRREALEMLRRTGYQVGTGVMIGLPGQTVENLADDLLALREWDIDMCGMGPYLEHPEAVLPPAEPNYTPEQRFRMGLGMIALLRHLMPDLNIASTTALHALHPKGREMGVAAGANVIMPNLSPGEVRKSYKLYDNKPLADMDLSGFNVALDGSWGDSRHFYGRRNRDEAGSDR